MSAISAAAARTLIHSGGEAALLDVREAGQFGEGHALFAVPAPYSRLEMTVPALVPRRDAPIILADGGDGVAVRAARALARLGYRSVDWIEGGMPAWQAAGFPIYKGVNVPSKMLGELAEERWHPKMITPDELADWQRSGVAFKLFDARPPAEYAKMRVPGAVCLPNGELAHRLAAAAGETEPVVVTCAGRTRGIVGAVGLELAGRKGRVFALENGTQGWALAGHVLERGNEARPYPALSEQELADASARAERIRERFRIPLVSPEEIETYRADPGRTTYLFDVRSEGEALNDPLPGTVWAPSGQLVQATDQWVGVRRARMVLFDDSGMRATLAAFWLKQLGYEPAVALIDERLRKAMRGSGEQTQNRGSGTGAAAAHLSSVGAIPALAAVAAGSAALIDLRPSLAYRKAHVEGALWLVRPNAALAGAALSGRAAFLIADDAEMAALAAGDLLDAGVGDIRLVEGGQDALAQAGASLVATPGIPSDAEAIDHLFFVHDRHDGNLEASRRYLAWETGLIAQADETELAEFRLVGPSG